MADNDALTLAASVGDALGVLAGDLGGSRLAFHGLNSFGVVWCGEAWDELARAFGNPRG